MSTKVVKATIQVGQANDQGVSFTEGALMFRAREGFMDIQQKIKSMGGVTTGPARVLVIVEQDVTIDD